MTDWGLMFMDRIFVIFFSLMIMFGCGSSKTAFRSVEPEEFEKILSRKDVVCLDVRTKEEYSEQHISNAINIDVKHPYFVEEAIKSLPKDKIIAVYCRSGKRSKKACELLAQNKFRKIVELNTGIIGWLDANKQVAR